MVTTLLITANLVVFAYEMLLMVQGGRALERFIEAHALVPGRLVAGWLDERQWATVFSSMFLHGGVGHVAGNCWFLWVFGRTVEDRIGGLTLLWFYGVAGVAAAALQVAVAPTATVPMVGASGAISGVLGAYLMLAPRAWVVALVPWVVPVLPVPALVFLGLWFALQAMQGVDVLLAGTAGAGGVAWWAHAGGFLTGVMLARSGRPSRGTRRRR